MKKERSFFKSPAFAVVLFIVAAALILTGGIGGTRAALTIRSQQYNAQLELQDIGVTLLERNSEDGDPNEAGVRDYRPYSDYVWDEQGTHRLCENLLGEDTSLKLGKKYGEYLSVLNSGNIDEYVRVRIYKYWAATDENGEVITNSDGTVQKRTDLDPALIDLNILKENGWIEPSGDEGRSPEYIELYYTNILAPTEETPFLTDTLKIDDSIAVKVEETRSVDDKGYTVLTHTYEYDGKQFIIEAEVDAVQTHNKVDAIRSAWGRTATFSGDTLTGIS